MCFAVGRCPELRVYLTISSLVPTFSVLPTFLLLYFIQQKIAEKSRALLPTAQRGSKQQVGPECFLRSVGVRGQRGICALGAPGKGRNHQGLTVQHNIHRFKYIYEKGSVKISVLNLK